MTKNKNLFVILLLTIAYTVLFNSFLIIPKIKILNHTNILSGIFISYVCSLLSCYALFMSLSFNRKFFIFTISLLFMISSIPVYFIYYYGLNINPDSLMLVLQGNIEEFLNFISPKLLLAIIAGTFIGFIVSKNITLSDSSHDKKYKQALCMFFIASIFVFDIKIIHEQLMPFNLADQAIQYTKECLRTKKKDYFEKVNFTKDENDIDVVVIIGESARADHCHINGYSRDTTPNLDKIKNLISYKDVKACANWTHDALPCVLTRAENKEEARLNNEASFITAFKKAGFDTIWLGNQGGFFSIENSFMRIAQESSISIIPSRAIYQGSQLDEELLPYLDDYLKTHDKSNLIIIHTMGSHYHYESRYPESFRKFKPVCEKRAWSREITHCSQEEIINSYDNTIAYTDYFINEIINRFHNRNAIVIYISDHAESLGENGVYLHGTDDRPEQYKIPIFFWASEKFRQLYPEKVRNVELNSKHKATHSNLFHTVLDLGGVKASIINDNLCLSK